jgi:succinoglycan biosynthesis protein ExoV
MRLAYYKGQKPNFGDDLNEDLWPRLIPDLLADDDPSGFLGIGTIIGMPTVCPFLHVFSSGLGYDSLDGWTTPHRVWCVRGPLTAALMGCPPARALTDGAILTPTAMQIDPDPDAAAPIGVIPHWASLDHPGWDAACAQAGMRLISPMEAPEAVIAKLRAVDLVLAESLHGAILADTYGIPWISIASTGNFSVFKWKDWTMSVEVPLNVGTVRPPSAAAALRFGRPFGAGWIGRTSFDEAAATAEFGARTRIESAGTADLGRRARAWAKRTPLAAAVAGMLGFSPSLTAEMLVAASRMEPTLSRASVRGSLRDRMLDQLAALARTTGRRVLA